MSISEVTVKGTYKKADGTPEIGTVKFRPALWQQSGSGIDAVLDSSGSFQTKFPSSDSGNWPDGLQIPYRVTVAVSSGTYVKELTFKSVDSPIDLPTLFPIVSADSGGSGGGSGGVPAAHAATHSPGGSDPLPELGRLGNLLGPARAGGSDLSGSYTTASTASVSTTAGRDGGPGIVWTPTTSGIISLWPGGNQPSSPGLVPVRAGQVVTWRASVRRAGAAGPQAAARIGWQPGGALSTGAWIAVGTDWTEVTHTAVVPAGVTGALGCIVAQSAVAGEALMVDELGVWSGAGGDWRPPGEPIPNLGFRTIKLGNAELLGVWQGGKWVPLSGDTGTFTVGNGTIRRVGNSVYLTATGYTPPTGFKPAQGGTAPTNVWYVTVDDWPTSVPGSAKL